MPAPEYGFPIRRREAKDPLDVQFARAARVDEFEAAFRCIYHAYHRQGLAPYSRLGIRMTRHHLLPATRVFAARMGGQVVGTISVVHDESLGVPMRSAFGPEIDELARNGGRLCEATCLALSDDCPAGAGVVHHLMGLAAQSAQRGGASRILIAVHPRHAPFYIRAIGFRPFGATTSYASVGGNPAMPLQLNLTTFHIDRPDAYRKYFGMPFGSSLLSTELPQPHLLHRLSVLWRILRGEGDEGEDQAQAMIAERLSA